MGIEINLLKNYPKTTRDLEGRNDDKNDKIQSIARQFGKEFFDGDRKYGYGGFYYFPRFWQPVIPTFQEHFNLTASSSVLDVGCAKGFMIHDMAELIPGINVQGIDISSYAIENSIDDMKANTQISDAKKLPFKDKSFDCVISINTLHNLVQDEVAIALQEIERICRGNSFITVDAYRSNEEKQRMLSWNLTAKTIMSVDEWMNFFNQTGYTGDYYWFTP